MPSPTPTLLHERDYFVRVAAADEGAFSIIFNHYTPRIQSFVKKITRSDEVTEEIIQDVFVSLWKCRETLKDVDNYAAFIYTIAANKTFNYLKVKARKEKHLAEMARSATDYTNNTVETIDLHETRERLRQLIRQLPPQKKLIYTLTRDEGLSHEQIATRLNISKNTVKNHLVETLKFLRLHLEPTEAMFLLLSLLEVSR